jgi:hypothetical protein
MEVKVYIESNAQLLEPALFGNRALIRGMTLRKLDQETYLRYEGTEVRLSLDVPDIIHITAGFVSSVGAGLVARWLYEKLKGKNVKILIEGLEVELDENKIKNILIKKIEVNR